MTIAFEAWADRARNVPIENELARRGVKLNGKNERAGPCPKCGGTDRFSINVTKRVWNCRHCGKGGDVIDLVRHIDGVDFVAACKTLTNEPPPSNGNANGHAPEPSKVKTGNWFKYTDESGTTLFAVRRVEFQNPDGSFVLKQDGKRKKAFEQARRGPDGEVIYGVEGVRVVPYRLPELLEAIANDRTVFIVEGEDKVDTLAQWNVPATCNAMGADKWKPEHSGFLNGADVVILPDNDHAGGEHGLKVAESLDGVAARIRIVELPGLPDKGDIIDWAAVGGTREQLDALVEAAADWQAAGNTRAKASSGSDETPPLPLIKSSAEFVKDFVPPDYLVDGLLQEGFLYSLTGATGAGKTAITLRLAASIAIGAMFAGRETKKRRVLYLAAENPDDVRMRWIALAQQMDFDIDAIEVFFVEGVFKISQAKDRLKEEAERRGGNFGMAIVDTSPVFYEGEDESSRTQQGHHAEMLRELIGVIPGKPAVIANCHPVKNAGPDNLVPAGGGNFLNSVDGNLTAAKTDSTTELHTQGKFRGVEFAPVHFLIKTVTHERVKDTKGRLIPTVICDWISDQQKDTLAAQKLTDEDAALKYISDNPKASQANIATAMGWKLYSGEPHKTKAGRCIKSLLAHKLIKETRNGNYVLTSEGNKTLEENQE